MGFGKDGKGVIIYDAVGENIGALASNDAIAFSSRAVGAMIEDFRMLKCEYWMAIRAAQAVVLADGPVVVGMAHGGLTAALIEETLESTVLDQGSFVAIEEASRPVWPLEVFMIPDADSGNVVDLTRKGSFTPRWTFNNPDGWVWWAYNLSSQVLITGNELNIQAKCFGVWVA